MLPKRVFLKLFHRRFYLCKEFALRSLIINCFFFANANFLIWLRQIFCNRDDATARRFIWLRQMWDVKRRKGVRSTHIVAPSRRRGYKNKQRSCILRNVSK